MSPQSRSPGVFLEFEEEAVARSFAVVKFWTFHDFHLKDSEDDWSCLDAFPDMS